MSLSITDQIYIRTRPIRGITWAWDTELLRDGELWRPVTMSRETKPNFLTTVIMVSYAITPFYSKSEGQELVIQFQEVEFKRFIRNTQIHTIV